MGGAFLFFNQCKFKNVYHERGGNRVDEYMRVLPHVILPNWLHLPSLVYLVKEGGIKILKGNIAPDGAILKVAGMKRKEFKIIQTFF